MKELRTEVRNSLLFSVHAGDVVRFAGVGLRGFLGGVADDAVADALVVAFDAPFFQQCFAFGEVEHLLGAVYPAIAQTYGMGGVHEVAHDQGAVIDAVGGLPLGEDDEDDGEVYQTTCPNCQEDVFFDEDILADGSILCPNCGEKLEFDLEEPDGCGGGCCGACAEPAAEDGEDDNG